MGKKDEQLGMPHGTAVARLRKAVLFKLLQDSGLNVCFQCDGIIENVNDLSLEHKKPWLDSDNPVETFFDLENVAFSHLHCNIAAAIKPNMGRKSPHGTTSKYNHQGCRCCECRAANARRREQQRRGLKQTGRWG